MLRDLFASLILSQSSSVIVVIQDMEEFLRERPQYLPELLSDAMDVRCGI
jgi:hypothetical protein